MLEKTAASSLECHSLKRILTASPSRQSQRRLHTAFWQHGASAFEISGWAFGRGAGGGNGGGRSATPTTAGDSVPAPTAAAPTVAVPVMLNASASSFLLDFLYPQGTLVYLRRHVPTLRDLLPTQHSTPAGERGFTTSVPRLKIRGKGSRKKTTSKSKAKGQDKKTKADRGSKGTTAEDPADEDFDNDIDADVATASTPEDTGNAAETMQDGDSRTDADTDTDADMDTPWRPQTQKKPRVKKAKAGRGAKGVKTPVPENGEPPDTTPGLASEPASQPAADPEQRHPEQRHPEQRHPEQARFGATGAIPTTTQLPLDFDPLSSALEAQAGEVSPNTMDTDMDTMEQEDSSSQAEARDADWDEMDPDREEEDDEFEGFTDDMKLDPTVTMETVLQDILAGNVSSDYNKAWSYYNQLEESQKGRYTSDMVQFLSKSSNRFNWDRVSRLFDTIPTAQWQPTVVETAIRIELARGLHFRAEAIFARMNNENLPFVVGFDLLLKHALMVRDWWSLSRVWLLYWPRRKMLTVDFNEILLQVQGLDEVALNLHNYLEAPTCPEDIAKATMYPLVKRIAKMASTTCGGFHAIKVLRLTESASHYRDYILRAAAMEQYDDFSLMYREYRRYPKYKIDPPMMRALFRGLYPRDLPGLRKLQDDFVRHNGGMDSWTYHKYLKLHAYYGDVEKVQQMWARWTSRFDEYEGEKILEMPRAFGHLLNVHASRGDADSTRRVFKELQAKYPTFKPDVSTWNILLKAEAKANQYQNTLETFSNMMGQGVEPDAISFGTVMGIAGSYGDLDLVMDAFKMAKTNEIAPDFYMIAAIVEACCNNDRFADADRVCQSGVTNFGIRSAMPWNKLLRFLASRRDLNSSYKLLTSMSENGVTWDDDTYEQLLRALVNCRQTQHAYHMLRLGYKDSVFNVTPEHFAIVMAGGLREGDILMTRNVGFRQKWADVDHTLSTHILLVDAMYRLVMQVSKSRAADQESFGDDDNDDGGGVVDQDGNMMDDDGYAMDKQQQQQEEEEHQQHQHQQQPALELEGEDPAGQPEIPWQVRSRYFGRQIIRHMMETIRQSKRDTLHRRRGAALVERGDECKVALNQRLMSRTIFILAQMRDFVSVEEFTALYQEALPDRGGLSGEWNVPVEVLNSCMLADYYEAKYDKVRETWERIFDLAKATAARGRIFHGKRYMLTVPLKTMMGMYVATKSPRALVQIVDRVRDAGFELDNKNWNMYAASLAKLGRVVDAFKACEEHLIGTWIPWDMDRPSANVPVDTRRLRMNRRHVHPTLRTMMALERAYATLAETALFSLEDDRLVKTMNDECPRTVSACKGLRRLGMIPADADLDAVTKRKTPRGSGRLSAAAASKLARDLRDADADADADDDDEADTTMAATTADDAPTAASKAELDEQAREMLEQLSRTPLTKRRRKRPPRRGLDGEVVGGGEGGGEGEGGGSRGDDSE